MEKTIRRIGAVGYKNALKVQKKRGAAGAKPSRGEPSPLNPILNGI